jgi:hypothetical protein
MKPKNEVLRRKWIDIKNDFKKSWYIIDKDEPEIFEEDNTQNDNFNIADREEGFKKSRRNYYYSEYE